MRTPRAAAPSSRRTAARRSTRDLAGNRGLLRCLSGYASCLWRLERRDEAALVLERMLQLDPADRQGVRPLLSAMRAGAPWSDAERS